MHKRIGLLFLCLAVCLYGYGCSARYTGASASAPPDSPTGDTTALPLIELTENLLTYDEGVWPSFAPKPGGESRQHPFDGRAAYNAFHADLNGDGLYEAYATLHVGSGIVTLSLIGYDPASNKTYELNERMANDYEFFGRDGELYVRVTPFGEGETASPQPERATVCRPALNEGTLSFDLTEVLT